MTDSQSWWIIGCGWTAVIGGVTMWLTRPTIKFRTPRLRWPWVWRSTAERLASEAIQNVEAMTKVRGELDEAKQASIAAAQKRQELEKALADERTLNEQHKADIATLEAENRRLTEKGESDDVLIRKLTFAAELHADENRRLTKANDIAVKVVSQEKDAARGRGVQRDAALADAQQLRTLFGRLLAPVEKSLVPIPDDWLVAFVLGTPDVMNDRLTLGEIRATQKEVKDGSS